jgi:SAM-dependent methyltransferase
VFFVKVRDSGMPDEEMWEQFFDTAVILTSFGLHHGVHDLAEFGSGYGTFTLAAARCVSGVVHAFDIEPDLVSMVQEKCRYAGLDNVQATVRDFVGQGTGLPDNSIDAALLFNILHHEEPVALMTEAGRILKAGGVLAVIHWNYDQTTPRGPSLEIRPRPEQCIDWGRQSGFALDERHRYDFPPYHYGLKFTKRKEAETNL